MFACNDSFVYFCPNVCVQEDDLHQIFMLTMEVLQEFSRRENLNAQMSSVFQRYLALANQVLSWNFLPPNHILYLVCSVSHWWVRTCVNPERKSYIIGQLLN